MLNALENYERRTMNKKELEKEYEKIRGEQTMEQAEPKDLYPIEDDVLAIALDYIPAKVLKRIIARYNNE